MWILKQEYEDFQNKEYVFEYNPYDSMREARIIVFNMNHELVMKLYDIGAKEMGKGNCRGTIGVGKRLPMLCKHIEEIL